MLLTGRPTDAIEALQQQVWRKQVEPSELADHEARYTVLSSRTVGGRPVIHVHSASDPGDGFTAVAPISRMCTSSACACRRVPVQPERSTP